MPLENLILCYVNFTSIRQKKKNSWVGILPLTSHLPLSTWITFGKIFPIFPSNMDRKCIIWPSCQEAMSDKTQSREVNILQEGSRGACTIYISGLHGAK